MFRIRTTLDNYKITEAVEIRELQSGECIYLESTFNEIGYPNNNMSVSALTTRGHIDAEYDGSIDETASDIKIVWAVQKGEGWTELHRLIGWNDRNGETHCISRSITEPCYTVFSLTRDNSIVYFGSEGLSQVMRVDDCYSLSEMRKFCFPIDSGEIEDLAQQYSL